MLFLTKSFVGHAGPHNDLSVENEDKKVVDHFAPQYFSLFTFKGKGFRQNGTFLPFNPKLSFENAVFQILPPYKNHQAVCLGSAKAEACEAGEFLASFVKRINNANVIPLRGTCFCLPRNALKNPTEDLALKEYKDGNVTDLNVFTLESADELDIEKFHPESIKGAWPAGSVFVRESNKTGKWVGIHNAEFKELEAIDNEKYSGLKYSHLGQELAENKQGKEELRARVKKLWDEINADEEWSKNKFPADKSSPEWVKNEVLKSYTYRTVNSLGADHFALATFYNAWKMSRITRAENQIFLKDIDKKTEEYLTKRFGSEAAKKILPSQMKLNKFIWEGIHEKVQTEESKETSNVDKYFNAALNTHSDDRIWKLIGESEEAFKKVREEHDLNEKDFISLEKAIKINDYSDQVVKIKLKRSADGIFPSNSYGSPYKNGIWYEDYSQFVMENLMRPKFRTMMYSKDSVVDNYCPKYKSLNTKQRAQFWASFMKGVAFSESGYNRHRGPKSGIMQLTCDANAKISYGCTCTSNSTFKNNPFKSIDCAMVIINHWLAKRSVLGHEGTHPYFETLRKGVRGKPLERKIPRIVYNEVGEMCGMKGPHW